MRRDLQWLARELVRLPKKLGGGTHVDRFGLGVYECKEAFVVLCRSEKLEHNTARAHGTHHRGDFERSLLILNRDLKIKNIVHMHGVWLSIMHPPIEISNTVPSPRTFPPENDKKR